jgi:hypothetical protein
MSNAASPSTNAGSFLVSGARLLLTMLNILLVFCSTHGRAEPSAIDRENYYRAVEYCRGSVPRPIAISSDGTMLCFDGRVSRYLDVSQAKDLKQDGLFVVRSRGGNAGPSMELSNLVRDRHATVVVYDYCFSACAVFFFVASYQTYVLKDTLVVWHNPVSANSRRPYCASVQKPLAGGPMKLLRGPCVDSTFDDQAAYTGGWPEVTKFFQDRVVNPLFEPPPDSVHVRKIVTSLYRETGVDHDVGWTIHPRYYSRLFKAKIFYEAYPESQDEVDDMLARLHEDWKVIYDP